VFSERLPIPKSSFTAIVYSDAYPAQKTLDSLRTVFGDRLPITADVRPDLVTPTEAAALLDTSINEVSRFKREGRISPTENIGRRIYYRRSDILALREQRAATPPRGGPQPQVERLCPICRGSFKDYVSEPRIYCSLRCRDTARLRHPSPKTAFGKFIRDEWIRSGENLTVFARGLSLGGWVIRSLLDDHPPADTTLAKLRAAFGDHLPPVTSSNELHRVEGRRRIQERLAAGLEPMPGTRAPESIVKRAASHRGYKPRPETIAKTRESQKSSPAWQEHMARNRKRMSSPSWRALTSLVRRLSGNPTPDDAALKQWAGPVAERLHLTSEAILALWRPTLVKRGLKGRAGRPRLRHRHQLVLEVIARHGVTPADRMPRGFWEEVFANVVSLEGESAPRDTQSIRQWWIDHKPACASCLSAAPSKPKA